MLIEIRRNFRRDLSRTRDAALRGRVDDAIAEIAAASAVHQIPGVARVQDPAGLYYRVRIGKYRLGFELVGDDTAALDRFLIRGKFYKHFPR